MSSSDKSPQEVRIIAELGINHNGDFSLAKELIHSAGEAGIWGIKFQYRNLDKTYSSSLNEIGDEILNQEIRANYLHPEEIMKLAEYARTHNLHAGISFFDASAITDFGAEFYECFDFTKVPSPEMTNTTLIDALIESGLETLISTGCHEEAEIEQALSPYSACANWLPLHCISNYPVSIRNAKLGYIKHMQDRWQRPVGYSSHDEHWEVCLLALALGAYVIERHLTYDKGAKGLDHTTSSTPDEFVKMQLFAGELPALLSGHGPRFPNQGERLNLQNLGRSYYVNRDLEPGEIVDDSILDLRTPRVGLSQQTMLPYVGKPATFKLTAGKPVTPSLFDGMPVPSQEAIIFARNNDISLPVRLHDVEEIQAIMPVGRNEFHLSFGEVLANPSVCSFNQNIAYSVHLPDYVNSSMLMNPFAEDEAHKEASRAILDGTIDFTRGLQDLTGLEVPIVGSFSLLAGSRDEHYSRYSEFLEEHKSNGISILPQWLPPIAWYFGGSVKLDVMVGLEDISLIEKYNTPICLDYCHLFMGAAYFGFSRAEAVERLLPFAGHIHIADAAGFDGEGVAFGEGSEEQMSLMQESLKRDCAKVVEVWQGHLDHYAGFVQALEALYQSSRDG